ncbi:MAG: hypothetical protein Q8M16_24200, partial [Pirellulaceae bacterium]|nr:hypothetical protein [Pirellulaceae bacterium]
MNSNTANLKLMRWRLLGKELRQLLPVFAATPVALVAFLFLVPTIGKLSPIRSGLPWELAYQLPGVVFSLGAVGLLVCQEKEQRSLTWLAALPIRALDIVYGKLWAGIVGVILVWSASVLTSVLLQPFFPVENDISQWLLCLVVDLYILIVGLAIVWRLESTFASIFLLLVMAFVPAGVAQGIDNIIFPGARVAAQSDFNTHVLLWICYLTLGIVALFLVRRWGLRALTATPTYAADFDRAWLPYRVSSSIPKRRHLMSPSTGLTWQMLRQNSWALAAIGVVFLFSLGQLAANWLDHSNTIALIAALAASWLGVLTFGGDAFKHQIRFLAERGVSPAKVWWTRHLVPLSMLSMYGILALAVATLVLNKQIVPQLSLQPRNYPITMANLFFLLMATLAFLLAVYSVSQWVGQRFQSVILAIVVIPPIAISTVAFTMTLLHWLGIETMFVGVLAIFPLVGTWWSMPAWMDRRLGFRSSVAQLGGAAAVVTLVLGTLIAWPHVMPLNINPVIAAEMHEFNVAQMRELIEGTRRSSYRNSVAPRLSIDDEAVRLKEDFRTSLFQDLSRVEQDLALSEYAVDIYLYQTDGFLLESLAELVPHWNIETAERTELFNRVLRAHVQLLRRLRQNCRIPEQEIADIGEIWLLQQLLRPESNKMIEDQLYNEMVTYLADDGARQNARRRALVVARWELEQTEVSAWQSNAPLEIAGLSVPWVLNGVTAASRNRQQNQKALELIEDLWVLAGKPYQTHDETLKRLAQNRQTPAINYGIGEQGKYYRVNDAAKVVP